MEVFSLFLLTEKIRFCLGCRAFISPQWTLAKKPMCLIATDLHLRAWLMLWYVKILKACAKRLCYFTIVTNHIECFADSVNQMFNCGENTLLSDSSNLGIIFDQSKYNIFIEQWNKNLLADIIYLKNCSLPIWGRLWKALENKPHRIFKKEKKINHKKIHLVRGKTFSGEETQRRRMEENFSTYNQLWDSF